MSGSNHTAACFDLTHAVNKGVCLWQDLAVTLQGVDAESTTTSINMQRAGPKLIISEQKITESHHFLSFVFTVSEESSFGGSKTVATVRLKLGSPLSL
jgi:hypothetical protein